MQSNHNSNFATPKNKPKSFLRIHLKFRWNPIQLSSQWEEVTFLHPPLTIAQNQDFYPTALMCVAWFVLYTRFTLHDDSCLPATSFRMCENEKFSSACWLTSPCLAVFWQRLSLKLASASEWVCLFVCVCTVCVWSKFVLFCCGKSAERGSCLLSLGGSFALEIYSPFTANPPLLSLLFLA